MNKIIVLIVMHLFTIGVSSQIAFNNITCEPGDEIIHSIDDGEFVYIGGYGTSATNSMIPAIAKVDTSGNTLWNLEFNGTRKGYIQQMIIVDEYIYTIARLYYYGDKYIDAYKVNKNSGEIVWQKNIYFSDGTTSYSSFEAKKLINISDTAISVLIIHNSSNYVFKSYINLYSLDSCNLLSSYCDNNSYKLENITIDTDGHYYAIGEDSLFCMPIHSPDSVIWKTHIDNTASDLNKNGIFVKDSNVFVITCSGNDNYGKVVKLSCDSGTVIWNTMGNSTKGDYGSYYLQDSSLYISWTPTNTYASSYIKLEKVNLSSGNVEWKRSIFTDNNASTLYARKIFVNDSIVYTTGGLKLDYSSAYHEGCWFIFGMNKISTDIKFLTKIYNDTSRYEVHSKGVGIHNLNNKIYCTGVLQALNQPSIVNQYTAHPMKTATLIALDNEGNVSKNKSLVLGTQPILPISTYDTIACDNQPISLNGNNPAIWNYEWYVGGTLYSNASDTLLNLAYSDSITSIISNNQCTEIKNWYVNINHVDTTVTSTDPTLTALAVNASIEWLDCFSGQIYQSSPNNSFTPLENGSYAAIVTQNGCTDTSTCYTIVSTNILNNHLINELKVYPNPTKGTICIELGKPYDKVEVSIKSMTGQIIYSFTSSIYDKKTFEFEAQPAVYYMVIKTKDSIETIKIIKN